ncbi:MAG: glycosyltransferase family 4 protein [Clostridium sp.]|nr:glycosyltransferase family 4 protein [Clostridium sp.]MCM1474925.1 glycosyltransferase family 4 protein [Muribaculaceae bacterium]
MQSKRPARPKVLFCDNSLRELVNFRLPVMQSYIRGGWDVIAVAPQNRECPDLGPHFRYYPVKLSRGGTNPFSDFRYFLQLLRIYRNERPDYIYHYTIKPNIYGTLASYILKIRCSAMIAGLGYVFTATNFGALVGRQLYRMAMRSTEHVIVLNQHNLELLRDKKIVAADKLILLPGGEGVDLEKFRTEDAQRNDAQRNDGRSKFLMIARVLYEKGYQEYVDAAAEIRRRHPECEFYLLGDLDPAFPHHVPRSVLDHDVDRGAIIYLGYCSDVVDVMKGADCIVHPSFYNEGMSRVLMEALALQKPVITTRIPGCQDLVEENVTGILCKPQDTQSLVEAIETFLKLNAEKRRGMGRAGRKLAERRFDIRRVIDIYHKITSNIKPKK